MQNMQKKYYNSTTLSICVVYTTHMSKNSIVSQDAIFYLLWYASFPEIAIYEKNLFFSHATVS